MFVSRDSVAFWGAAAALILTYAASAAPVPLYETWRSVDGLSYNDLSLSAVVYFAGAVSALVIFGRISDYLGRRPVAILAMLLNAVACLLFLTVNRAEPLIAGRLLQGLASGLASTAMAAWIVDTVKPSHSKLPALLISTSPLAGLSLGSLGGGSLISFAPYPRTLVFVISVLLMIISIFVLIYGQESVQRRPGLFRSLRPAFGLPASGKPWYPLAAVVFTCTWSMGGFYQAFGPVIAAQYLHSTSAIAAAVVFASYMLPSLLGSTLANKVTPGRAMIIGMLTFMLAIIAAVSALYAGVLVPFLIASAFAGAAQGATMNAGIRGLMTGASAAERAGTFSVIYATAYTGAAVPTLIVGRLTSHFSLLQLASAYALLAIGGFMLVCWLLALKIRKDNPEENQPENQA